MALPAEPVRREYSLASSAISSLNSPSTPVGTFSTSVVVAATITGQCELVQPSRRVSKHSRSTVVIGGSVGRKCGR
mgnify:CR=1 FL=1|jgi:hypothetical protein